MFQYAAGMALARRLGVPHKLDLSAFEHGYELHAYALSSLNISAETATAAEVRALKNRRLKALPKAIRPALEKKRTHYRNLSLKFDPCFFDLKAPVYLEGYFQSARYFEGMEEEVRREFRVKAPPSRENQELLQRISQTDGSIAVHVRRGDYVSDPATLARHGTCSPGYYRKAGSVVREQVKAPHAFVFSDDPAWAEANLELPIPMEMVNLNSAATAYEDLRLMSACRHFIVANSSFSWWGAWLAHSPEKIVCAPERWMADPNVDATDVIAPEWLKVSA